MGFLVVLASDDSFLRAQVGSESGARRALSDLVSVLGSDTYPTVDPGGTVGAWRRLGSVHSRSWGVVVACGEGARLCPPDSVKTFDVESGWIPSSQSLSVSSREQEFVRHPERFPQTLALVRAGLGMTEALHGLDRSAQSRLSIWVAHADTLPFSPGPDSAAQLCRAVSEREHSVLAGSFGAQVLRLGGVGRVPAGGAVHLFAGGNRVARFDELLDSERESLIQLGYGVGARS